MKLVLIISAIVFGLLSSATPAPGADAWYPQYLTLLAFGFLCAAYYISRMSLAIGLFVAYLTFNTFFIAHQNLVSIMSLASVVLFLLIARLVSSLNEWQKNKVWQAIFVTFIIQVTLGVIQILNLDPLFHKIGMNGYSDVVGFSASHNQYALSLAATSISLLTIPLIYALPLALIAILCILQSTTFTAILGLASAWLFYFYKGFNKDLISLLTIFILIVSIGIYVKPSVMTSKLNERLRVWSLTLKQSISGIAEQNLDGHVHHFITTNPIFGYGFGSFFFISPYTQYKVLCKGMDRNYNDCLQVGKFEHAHNDYLEVLFDLGYVGMALFFYIVYEISKLYRENIKLGKMLKLSLAGIVAYGVCALSIYTVHTAYSGFLLCIFIGLFYGEINYGTQGRQPRIA